MTCHQRKHAVCVQINDLLKGHYTNLVTLTHMHGVVAAYKSWLLYLLRGRKWNDLFTWAPLVGLLQMNCLHIIRTVVRFDPHPHLKQQSITFLVSSLVFKTAATPSVLQLFFVKRSWDLLTSLLSTMMQFFLLKCACACLSGEEN